MSYRSILLLIATVLPAAAAIPAFPGAEGYGAYATGGRGGDVYYVTTLNNNGAGSLREGLNTVPAEGRTIVFAVSGYIPVVSDTNFNVPSNVTIAGQTAPGDGVGLRGGRMMISGSNSIMRHFRIRHGKNGTGGDCLNIDSTASSTMLDHISMMFSTDENFSFFNSSVNDFTMQYSNSTWGMERHNAGGLWDLQNGSCHHSLWAHHRTRNPKARPGGLLEWVNNVTFHWRNEGFIMGDSQTPANWKANVRGCYYIAIDDADDGSTLHSTSLTKAQVASNNVPNFSLFLDNTLFDSNDNGILDGTNNGYAIVSGSEFTPGDPVGANRYYKSVTPFTGATGLATVTVDNPLTGYKKVLSSAAPLRLDANYTGPLRDELDALLNDTVVKQYSILVQKDGKVAGEDPTRTSNGEQLLADQYGITNNGFGTLNGTTPPTDSDLDGMPDAWEITLNGLNGMNFNVAADDHNTVFSAGQLSNTFFPTATPTGYTYLEEYLHFLAVPHATVAKNTAAAPSAQVVDLRKYTDGFSATPTFAVTNTFNGTTQQYLANGTTLAANGPIVKFTPTLNAIGRGGFNFTVTDADGSQWTQQFALLISAAAAPRDLLWIGNGSTNIWDNATPSWRTPSGVATTFGVGDTALFDDRGSATPATNLSSTQNAGSVLVTGTKNYTLSGSGSIASTGSLTKAGDTTLILSANTSFAAGTFLNGGATNISDNKTLSGGAVRFSGGATLNVNYASGSYFTLNPNVQVDAGATGNINLSQRSELNGSLSGGGTFNIFSPSNLGTEGRVYFDGASAGCTGQVNLSGGATSPGNAGRMAFRANGGSFNGFGNAKVNLSGLDLFTTNNSAGNTYTLGELSGDANSRLRSNYLNGGGATTWSVGSRNTSTTFAGVIMDGTRTDGSNSPTNLTKTGSGTFTLSGTNSYAGATTVSGGTLRVTGSLGASAVTIASGAKLSGSAALGGTLTLSGGSTVDPGNAPETVGTMSVTNGLTLSSGSNYLFDLSSNPNAGNDQIIVQAGSLSQTGTLNFVFNPIDGYLGAGTYYLITGAPNSSASSVLFTSNFPANTRQTFTIARSSTSAAGAKSIWLTVVGSVESLVWTGSTSIWDIANATPWTGSPSSDNRFFNLDTVTFNNTAANRTATLSAALEPTEVIVDNSGTAYTFNGSGNLAGGSALTKRGTGNLMLSNTTANSHGGGTFIEAGTLTLGNNTAGLGNGIVHLQGGTLALPNDPTYISNSFVISSNSAISSPYNGNSTILNSTSNTLTSVGNPTLSLAGVNGILSINGSMSGYSGTINFGSASGMLRLNSNSIGSSDVNFGSANTHFDLGNGSARLTNRNGDITIHVGALSGGPNTHLDGRQSGSGNTTTTYIIGEKNLSTTFSGSISHANDLSGLAIIKTGSGVLTLAGTSSFIGSLAVNQGEIAISGNTTMTGNATLKSGSTLSLAGGTLGVSILDTIGNLSGYGTVVGEMSASGNYTGRGFGTGTPGVLQISGSASFNSGTLKMLGGALSDRIEAAGDLTVTGTVQIALSSGTTFGRYTLATYGGTLDMTGVNLTGIPSGTSAYLSTTIPGKIDLVIDNPAPQITSGPTASSNPITTTGTNLSVVATDDTGEANLTYTWTASGPAPVSFSVNGNNASKNAAAVFSKAGSYTLTATATDATGLTATNSINVTVNATPTILTTSPSNTTLAVNSTATFSATVIDQFGIAISNPSVTWSTSGGGAIGTTGLYTATTAGGPYQVTATSGGLSTNASITVTKATPTISVAPTASAITYGQALSSSSLLGGTATVAGTFTFTTPGTIPNAGTTNQSVTFTPTNTSNYNIVTTTINVTVTKATATVTLGNLSATYDGTAKSATATTTPNSLTVNFTYDGSAISPTNAGTYSVVGTINDANYTGSAMGFLVITPSASRSFSTWVGEHFTPTQITSGESTATADPDHDGLNNLAEYALGGLPYTFTPQPTITENTTSLSITFQRPAQTNDVTYYAETSPDFANWQALTLDVLSIGIDPETVRATYTYPSTKPANQFIRLRFEQ